MGAPPPSTATQAKHTEGRGAMGAPHLDHYLLHRCDSDRAANAREKKKRSTIPTKYPNALGTHRRGGDGRPAPPKSLLLGVPMIELLNARKH